MTLFALVKAGYGSLSDLKELDTPEFLDIIEYEMMRGDIEHYKIEESRRG